MKRTAFLIAATVLVAIVPAKAHDPFTGLHNQRGTSCCSSDGPASDCKAAIIRYDGNRLQAQIDERWRYWSADMPLPIWVDIPDDKVLPMESNPVAGPVVCWLPSMGVICYLPGRDS